MTKAEARRVMAKEIAKAVEAAKEDARKKELESGHKKAGIGARPRVRVRLGR